ncbi:RHS repeat domain-containing protein [Chitinibacter fontanus]|uniref:RHS repeat domain-containing protein n=1 Tax=Chitinibacter fontanus TaxID=1737446 RepID=UPI002240527A
MWRANFKPFGDKTSASGASTPIKNQQWFTGKPHEEATGLSYFGARWYDPVLGRFTAIDPAYWNESNPIHSFNRYAYANNNPFRFVDPDGRNSEEADLGLGNECSCNLLAKTFSEYVTEAWNGLVLAAQKSAEFGAFLIGKTKILVLQ